MHMRINWSKSFNTVAFLCEKAGIWHDFSAISMIFIIYH